MNSEYMKYDASSCNRTDSTMGSPTAIISLGTDEWMRSVSLSLRLWDRDSRILAQSHSWAHKTEARTQSSLSLRIIWETRGE